MRVWKVVLGAGVAVAAVAVWHVVDRNAKDMVAGAATPNPAMMAMPVPVTKIIKKTLPIYLEYSARTESIGNVTLQAKVSGFLKEQLRARRGRRQAGRPAL